MILTRFYIGRAPNVSGPSHTANIAAQSIPYSSASQTATAATTSVSSGQQQPAPAATTSSGPQKSSSQGPGPFTVEQLAILRSQIFSFKILSKNLPIPSNIQQQLFGSQQGKRPQSVGQAVVAAGQILD